MIAPRMSLMNDKGVGVLLLDGHDVAITREHVDALAELLDPNGRTGPWQAARDLLEWSNETPCHTCRQSPVVVRDNQGYPRCADCQDAAVRASRQAADAFKAGLS